MKITYTLFFISLFFIAKTWTMETPLSKFELQVQCKGFTEETFLTTICKAPNQTQPFWPILLYPHNDTEQDPERCPCHELIAFYWKKCHDIRQFPDYLNQLVNISKNYTPHTEWNVCFEEIYTQIGSLMQLNLQVIEIFKHAYTQEMVAKLSQEDKKHNQNSLNYKQKFSEILSLDPAQNLNEYKIFFEKHFFALYNYFVTQTVKAPNESINDFKTKINAIFNNEMQRFINNFKNLLTRIKI